MILCKARKTIRRFLEVFEKILFFKRLKLKTIAVTKLIMRKVRAYLKAKGADVSGEIKM
jgi:hypothetical protein